MHLLVRQQADQGTPIVNVRFFGKIFGLRADYYIVEAKFESYDDIKTDVPLAQMEPPGTGANEYIYFAANHPEATWTQLPWVTAEMIQTSRQMRRFFTGNLMSSVLGYPRFPFGEAALLRAQLARIVAATSISPRGYYAADEDADDENAPPTISEEFEVPTAAELVTLESWVHHRPYVLNKQGRVIAYTEEKDNDVDDDADEEDEEEAPGQLNALEEDKQDDLKKMWILRQNPKGPHCVTTVTSLLWPGAVAACKGEKWSNIYVGFGHKYLPGLYTPPPPPPIQMEFKAEFDPDDEDDVDPIIEQVDPLPRGDEGGEGEGDEEDDEDDDD
jgi:radial spoke head protein 4A